MSDIGLPELLIILAIIIVLFGANRLRELGRALGSSIHEFKQAVREEQPPAVLPLQTRHRTSHRSHGAA